MRRGERGLKTLNYFYLGDMTAINVFTNGDSPIPKTFLQFPTLSILKNIS